MGLFPPISWSLKLLTLLVLPQPSSTVEFHSPRDSSFEGRRYASPKAPSPPAAAKPNQLWGPPMEPPDLSKDDRQQSQKSLGPR